MKYFLVLLLLPLFSQCSNLDSSKFQIKHQSSIESETQAHNENSPDNHNTKNHTKIIKQGSLEFEVLKLDTAKILVNNLVEKYHGYFETESYVNGDYRKTYILRIRIPNTNFNSLIERLEQTIPNRTAKNLNTQNVGEEYADLKMRLASKLKYLEQYRSILKKAKTIEEILAIQNEVRNIEEEIEASKGRIQYLDNQVEFSSLDLQISEKHPSVAASSPSFLSSFKNSFFFGYNAMLQLILLIVKLWPFIVLIIIIFVVRKTMKKSSFRTSNS